MKHSCFVDLLNLEPFFDYFPNENFAPIFDSLSESVNENLLQLPKNVHLLVRCVSRPEFVEIGTRLVSCVDLP